MSRFTLHIPKDIEGQLQRCRASIRESIHKRLQTILEGLAKRPPGRGRGKKTTTSGPPTRFYVFEGYRVSYEVNPLTRRVVVLSLQAEPG